MHLSTQATHVCFLLLSQFSFIYWKLSRCKVANCSAEYFILDNIHRYKKHSRSVRALSGHVLSGSDPLQLAADQRPCNLFHPNLIFLSQHTALHFCSPLIPFEKRKPPLALLLGEQGSSQAWQHHRMINVVVRWRKSTPLRAAVFFSRFSLFPFFAYLSVQYFVYDYGLYN